MRPRASSSAGSGQWSPRPPRPPPERRSPRDQHQRPPRSPELNDQQQVAAVIDVRQRLDAADDAAAELRAGAQHGLEAAAAVPAQEPGLDRLLGAVVDEADAGEEDDVARAVRAHRADLEEPVLVALVVLAEALLALEGDLALRAGLPLAEADRARRLAGVVEADLVGRAAEVVERDALHVDH